MRGPAIGTDEGVDGVTARSLPETNRGTSPGTSSGRGGARWSRLVDSSVWIAGAVPIALFTIWGLKGGGFDPTVWLPGALLVVGLFLAVYIGAGESRQLGRRGFVALLALAGFAAWSYVSMLWADVPGDAWIGANRAALYLAVFGLFALLPWTPRAASVAVWAFAAGVAGTAAFAVGRIAVTADEALFINGQLAYPTGYANATVGLFMAGFWLALAVATRREQPVVARALALGAVVLLPQASLIVQSRATFVAVPVAAALVFAVTPGRLRTALGLTVAAVPVAIGWNVHLAVFETAEVGGPFLEEAFPASARFMAVTSAGAVLVGLLWALADRRVSVSPRVTRALNVLLAVVAAAGVLVCAGLVVGSDPVDRVEVAWSEFTTNETDYEGASRLGSFDSERWDHWRVGLDRFLDRPLTGLGVEQFNVDYLRDRRTSVDARYAHSLEVGILSQLGLIGAVLFAAFAAAATLLVVPRRRDGAGVSVLHMAAFGLWAYWLLHASVDWFWEIPAVTAPVVAFVGIAAALDRPVEARRPGPRRSRVLGVLVLATGLALAASLTMPYLAAREVRRAVNVWASRPDVAYERLERARKLDPLSDEPDLYAGAIAARRDDRTRMRIHFSQALDRNPHNWYAHLELGLTHSLDGRQRDAVREVESAVELNPNEPILTDVLERLERGEVVSPREVDRLFVDRILERLR